MNQLVQELAKQAQYNSLLEKYYLQEVHKTKIAPIKYQRIYDKKFAELIVIEMCGMMGQAEDDLYSLEPSERPTEYIEWLRNWQERFTKHFGVE